LVSWLRKFSSKKIDEFRSDDSGASDDDSLKTLSENVKSAVWASVFDHKRQSSHAHRSPTPSGKVSNSTRDTRASPSIGSGPTLSSYNHSDRRRSRRRYRGSSDASHGSMLSTMNGSSHPEEKRSQPETTIQADRRVVNDVQSKNGVSAEESELVSALVRCPPEDKDKIIAKLRELRNFPELPLPSPPLPPPTPVAADVSTIRAIDMLGHPQSAPDRSSSRSSSQKEEKQSFRSALSNRSGREPYRESQQAIDREYPQTFGEPALVSRSSGAAPINYTRHNSAATSKAVLAQDGYHLAGEERTKENIRSGESESSLATSVGGVCCIVSYCLS
jgi:hypothetical protein